MLKVEVDLENGIYVIDAKGGDGDILRELFIVIGQMYASFEKMGCGNKFKHALRYYVKKRNSPLWAAELEDGTELMCYNIKSMKAALGGDQ